MMDPSELPIYRYEQDIIRALNEHRVIVLEGPTGSGKTTQVPQMIERAYMTDLMIGMTQPRRIAAVSVAARIADELNVELGEEVGYSIRFDDASSPNTKIRLMTDGILLQEARTDPYFSRYGVIIVDEAHERTLNIDMTLGLLNRALRYREDLRVVISSATIKAESFQAYFAEVAGEVPLISVDARPYPVEIRYKPPRFKDQHSLIEKMCEEILALAEMQEPGHILAFLSGQGSIMALQDALYQSKRLPKNAHIFPLYGKLTRQEQEEIFVELPEGQRKIILATNIAETSITVPGVRYVLDSGLVKVPRFRPKTGISILSEEGNSKASADQRAGRSGRTAPGIAIRLYSKKSYKERPAFTSEEILRLDLTEVVMRLLDLGIKDLSGFPLPTPLRKNGLNAALKLLKNMGAIDEDRNLTPIGKKMMVFPLSAPLGRMVLEAAETSPTVLDEILMVAAFMSARSPFLYPRGEEAEARAAQRALAHPLGDAMTAVKTLSGYIHSANGQGFAVNHYLDLDTMGFIKKAYEQLKELALSQNMLVEKGGPESEIVRCFSRGFAHQFLKRRGRFFQNLFEDKILIHPSSSLFGTRAPFVIAAEIVISTQPYARHVTEVEAKWLLAYNPELAKAWDLRPKKKSETPSLPKSEGIPSSIALGKLKLEVVKKRNSPVIQLPREALLALPTLDPRLIPKELHSWKAQVFSESPSPKPKDKNHRVHWGFPLKFKTWYRLSHILELPEQPSYPPRKLPLAAFLEINQHLHTLERFVPDLQKPYLQKRRRGGWLTLVSNGDDGFWFDMLSSWRDALDTNLSSLLELEDKLPEGDAAQKGIAKKKDALIELAQRYQELKSSR